MERRKYINIWDLDDEQISCEGIWLQNLEMPFEFDTTMFAGDKSCCTQKISIDNVVCEKMTFANLRIAEDVIVKESYIPKLNFSHCEFGVGEYDTSLFLQVDSVREITFKECVFKGGVNLLIGQVNGMIEFEECLVEKDLMFSNLCLEEKSKISLNGSKARVKGDCTFRFCNICGELNIRSDIDKSLRLSAININDEGKVINASQSSLIIHGCSIRDVCFFKCNLHRVDVVNADLYNIREQMSSFELLQNDAPRIFRDAAIKNNDEVNIQKYTTALYDQILKEKANPLDKIMLWLNKCSNAYGMSWFRGVVFTLVVTLTLYFLLNYFGCENQYFVFDLKFRGFGEVCLGFFSLMDIFGLADTGIELELTPTGKCMLFVGRIFIAYGIWQTIYAFYKFKK